MGSGHAKNFKKGKIENGVLTAVCDINPKKFDFFKENFGDDIKYFTDAEEMFKSGTVDCVMICTPHYIHPDLAILAMDNNLHCIVEKPAGVYTLQVKEMLKRDETNDKVLGIMFNQRMNPAFIKMRQMIADGAIGNIKRTNWIITDGTELSSTTIAVTGALPGRARAEAFSTTRPPTSLTFSSG